jgi:hypothetical protein
MVLLEQQQSALVVRDRGDRHECAHCGEPLDLARTERPVVMFESSTRQPLTRVLIVDGNPIHRWLLGRKGTRPSLDSDGD